MPSCQAVFPVPVERRHRRQLTARLADRVASTRSGQRLSSAIDGARRRAVPLHWSNMFGIVSLASLAVLFATGLVLMFFYVPSDTPLTYTGDYVPLAGTEVSSAFASTMHLSFGVGGGLLIRQAHHWAALLLPASVIMQLLVTFFTGGFRKPRRGAWLLLFTLLIVALIGGWSGYALPDDMLSGSGLRIVEGIAIGIPFIGVWASGLLFGGEFPGEIIPHLYPVHIAIVPVLLVILVVARARTAYLTKPAQFRGPGREEDNVVGVPLVPTALTRAAGLFCITTGLIFLIAATATINPVWLYGPSSAGEASAGSQPDWYTGFLDGALRLVPPGWEFVLFDRTLSLAILAPLIVVSLFLALVALYPFIEGWTIGDDSEHHLLDRPRDVPSRTAIGVAGIVFYGTLWAAGSADVMAVQLGLSIEGVIAFLQLALIVGPSIGFAVTRVVCIGLRRKDQEIVLHGYETGRIVRLPGGNYVEIHTAVDDERWRLTDSSQFAPLALRPNERGKVTRAERLRVHLSQFLLEDRIVSSIPRETSPDAPAHSSLVAAAAVKQNAHIDDTDPSHDRVDSSLVV